MRGGDTLRFLQSVFPNTTEQYMGKFGAAARYVAPHATNTYVEKEINSKYGPNVGPKIVNTLQTLDRINHLPKEEYDNKDKTLENINRFQINHGYSGGKKKKTLKSKRHGKRTKKRKEKKTSHNSRKKRSTLK